VQKGTEVVLVPRVINILKIIRTSSTKNVRRSLARCGAALETGKT
jgi:hypothetical protein